jgi:hypothetical protein
MERARRRRQLLPDERVIFACPFLVEMTGRSSKFATLLTVFGRIKIPT